MDKPLLPARPAAAFASLGALLVFTLAAYAAPPVKLKSPVPVVEFNRDVRPILGDNCFKCHGFDDRQRQANLRLDTPQGAYSKGASGRAAIVPGNPKESELLRRLTVKGPLHMPPLSTGKTLTAEQIATLNRWVAQGAKYETHWAFVPPVRPALPKVRNAKWARNPVDAFIMERLEREKISPSPEADRTTLLRRLSLDLIGLPPTPQEVDAFLKDTSPKAYEKQVERLLASPHYGERWGRLWLDAARYADSDGFEKDKPRWVWFYRDWVINSLNRDLPYNQFIIEQIAGDLLPHARQDQVVATGFLRNSMINEEGGVNPEQFRMEAMFDRMDALGKGVLGLTIQCAQCHTHKYDPLTHEEYYKMFAFLNNSDEANVAVYTPSDERKRADVLRGVGEIEAGLRHMTPDWTQRMAAWEATLRAGNPAWTVLKVEGDETSGQRLFPQPDGSILAQGYAPTQFTGVFKAQIGTEPVTAVRLELLNDPNLPRNGPGRSIFGTCALTEVRVDAAPADKPGEAKSVRIVSATADVNPAERELAPIFDNRSNKRRVTGPITYAIDGNNETAWGIDIGPGRTNVPRNAVFVLEKPVSFPAGTLLTIRLTQNHGGWNSDDNQNHNLGRFRLSVTNAPSPTADPLSPALRALLDVPQERRTPAQQAALFSVWRATVPEWKEANAQIEQLWAQHPEPSTQLVLQEKRTMPRTTSLLDRGDWLKPKKPVTAGVPAFLNTGKTVPRTRLEFARWLVDRRSPTTARALVNRVWQTYFGTGIVRSAEDLGTQSETPSHPELLDWLAVEFMEPSRAAPVREKGQPAGWSLKHLHRIIVTSATYRQSSRVTPGAFERDPENRLLARGPRLRVDAELVRDAALAASGLLNPKVGGPSVNPPAPEFLFQPPASYGPKVWKEATGGDRYRRALYTFRYRSVPYPALQAFDAPNGDASCVRRSRSNTPLQALTLLNEPLFLECARALALKTVQEGGNTDSARLAFAFRRCVARPPTAKEAVALTDLLEKQTKRFAATDPWALAAPDAKARPTLPPDTSPARFAAWTVVSRVLLNLDETITKE